MTDKITLTLTLDELKTLDKHIEYNEETKSVFDKIKYAYPQLKMTLQQEGEYAVVSYNDTTYCRLMGEIAFCWYIKKGVSANYHTPTLVMVTDAETERLLEGLYYNHIEVKKETAQEPKDNEWKNVALEFGKKLPAILPYSYAELSPNSWYRWVVFTYDKYMEERDKECGYTPNQKAQERGERVHNEMEEVVRESVKWCEENQDKDPLEWLTPKTPEETAESLREAFVKAQQTEKWKELQRKIDEEDNDKNFKNSLDLIKEWGEKNKSKTLYQICMEWWNEVFVNQMDDDICVDVLVSKIDKEFIPPSSEKNGYEWEKCLKIMRDKLR
jgi:hypothetical protein